MTPDMKSVLPRQRVPALKVPLTGGGNFDVSAESPRAFTLIVFYRGLHCPICRTQLADLHSRLGEFESRGVAIVAISTDTEERAAVAKMQWKLPDLRVGYAL